MKELIVILFLAIVIDIIVGDPEKLTHPVVLMGKLIEWLEGLLYSSGGSTALILRGGILVVIVLLIVYAVAAAIIGISFFINYWLGILVSSWLLSTTLATKSLKKAALDIYYPLINSDLAAARKMLSYVVSRETDNLSPSEITRGAVETVAENTVDGVIAPLIYGIVGGPGLALMYKGVNTLDSMLGYKNDRYLYFGRMAARLDDIANYLPARITGIYMLIATLIMNLPALKAMLAWRKFAHQHPSPNGGIPESVVAGALGVQLGGYNWYHGEKNFRAYMGNGERALVPKDILITVKLMYLTTFLVGGSGIVLLTGLLLLGGS